MAFGESQCPYLIKWCNYALNSAGRSGHGISNTGKGEEYTVVTKMIKELQQRDVKWSISLEKNEDFFFSEWHDDQKIHGEAV